MSDADAVAAELLGMQSSRPAYFQTACCNCAFWDETGPGIGKCRRAPPAAHPGSTAALWPTTGEADWCGDFARAVGR